MRQIDWRSRNVLWIRSVQQMCAACAGEREPRETHRESRNGARKADGFGCEPARSQMAEANSEQLDGDGPGGKLKMGCGYAPWRGESGGRVVRRKVADQIGSDQVVWSRVGRLKDRKKEAAPVQQPAASSSSRSRSGVRVLNLMGCLRRPPGSLSVVSACG